MIFSSFEQSEGVQHALRISCSFVHPFMISLVYRSNVGARHGTSPCVGSLARALLSHCHHMESFDVEYGRLCTWQAVRCGPQGWKSWQMSDCTELHVIQLILWHVSDLTSNEAQFAHCHCVHGRIWNFCLFSRRCTEAPAYLPDETLLSL